MTDSLGRHSNSNALSTDRLAGASVNADAILEPASPDPRRGGDPAQAAVGAPIQGAPTPASPVSPLAEWPAPGTLPAAAALPAAPVRALLARPLAGLHWGAPGRAAPSSCGPRVRGDHALIHLRGGDLAFALPGRAQALAGDHLLHVPPGTAFALRAGAEARGWLLLIPPLLGAGLPEGFRCGAPEAADAALLDRLLPALAGAEVAALPAPLQAGRLAPLRPVLERLQPPGPARRPDLFQARTLAARFLDLLQQDPVQDRTMADYARSLGCSLALLDQACRDSRGRSALDLLYRLRLDRAAAMLRASAAPTAQIATELGFSSLGHFTRVFGAATGIAPDSFRARAQRDQAAATKI